MEGRHSRDGRTTRRQNTTNLKILAGCAESYIGCVSVRSPIINVATVIKLAIVKDVAALQIDVANMSTTTTLQAEVKSMAARHLGAFPISFDEVAYETKSDPLLWKLCEYVQNEWPRNATFSGEISQYYHRKNNLSTIEDCIFFGERVFIPERLRERCLLQLHRGHTGIQGLKAIARSYVYNTHPVPWPNTKTPWERIHVD